jgi:hypothetical protein
MQHNGCPSYRQRAWSAAAVGMSTIVGPATPGVNETAARPSTARMASTAGVAAIAGVLGAAGMLAKVGYYH